MRFGTRYSSIATVPDIGSEVLTVQEEEHDDDDDDLDEELDDEVSHRKQIKYNSERVEQQQQIRNKRKAKSKKKDT